MAPFYWIPVLFLDIFSLTQSSSFYRQIAVFHNNIGGSILPYLKPLMLEAAVVLSTIVQEQVTWDSAEVNDYIRRLQAAVHRLAALNQQLNHCNTQIQAKVGLSARIGFEMYDGFIRMLPAIL